MQELTVYGVQKFRIDTTKEGDGEILRLYTSKAQAQKHVDNLNSLYSQDEYCVYRARVEPMMVHREFTTPD